MRPHGFLVFVDGITQQFKAGFYNCAIERSDPAQWDTRSDNKGHEQVSVVLGTSYGHVYAFVGLERACGGVMIYDVTAPAAPVFMGYAPGAAGDISPEGMKFIPAADSPTGHDLLVLAHELSGSTFLPDEYRL